MVNLTFISSVGIINWVDNVNWPPSIVSKLTLPALALCQSDWRNCGLCVYRIYSIIRRPRINAAFKSRNINKRRPRIDGALWCGVYPIIDSKSTLRSVLQLRLEILSEPSTNSFECTSSDVEKALDLYSFYTYCNSTRININIVKLRTI